MVSVAELQQRVAELEAELERLRGPSTPPGPADGQQPQQLPAACGCSAEPAAAAAPSSAGSSTCHEPAYSAVHGLSKNQVERYSRQLLLPSFGVAAQGRLCSSRVLIVGCGGLGSPAALYLAAAGVGTLGLVDHDVVELSNMHRQVIHTEAAARAGTHKAASAAAAVAALNSSVRVTTHLEGLAPRNAFDLVSRYDVVIDASDNPPTRYLLNDACVAAGRPLVSAAAVGTDGQLTVLNAGADGPCYRCLFPECPAPANCARCADAGVLGPVPGVMGVLQALEAIKLAARVGEPLAGRLLLFDGLAGRFSLIKLRPRAPGCVACAPGAALTRDAAAIAAYDYAAFTGGQRPDDGAPAPLDVLPAEQRISARRLAQQLGVQQLSQAGAVPAGGERAQQQGQPPQQQGQPQQQQGPPPQQQGQPQPQHKDAQAPPLLLDVRPAEQFAIMALPGAVNVPYLQFDQRLPEALQLCGAPPPPQLPQHGAAADAGAQPAGSAAGGGAAAGGRPVVVVCRRGNHSQLAVQRLRQAGVVAVDVVGGYEAWAAEVDPSMPCL